MKMKTVSKINQSLEQPWLADLFDVAKTLLRLAILLSLLIFRLNQLV